MEVQTLHLQNVIKNHTQDMTNKVDAITGTTSGTGFPELFTPEDILLDPQNIQINWEGCEAAVGEFVL